MVYVLQWMIETRTIESCGAQGLEVLYKKLWNWMERGEQCVVARQLRERCQSSSTDGIEWRGKFWFLEMDDVDSVQALASGAQGTVSKVTWRHGLFARKEFRFKVEFDKEIDIALNLVSHPNIVHYFGCSLDEDDKYSLYMEFLGGDLESFLLERSRVTSLNDPPFAYQDLLDVLLQIAHAMEHLHEKNVIHGDLKPGNILLDRFELIDSDAKYCLVKVADFGSAQRVKSFNCPAGTLKYTAPEVFKWRKRKSHPVRNGRESTEIVDLTLEVQPLKIDVYSFGIVAYQVLTGHPDPYEGIEFKDFRLRVMKGLRPDSHTKREEIIQRYPKHTDAASVLLDMVQRCWSAEPAQRPPFSNIRRTIQALMQVHLSNPSFISAPPKILRL